MIARDGRRVGSSQVSRPLACLSRINGRLNRLGCCRTERKTRWTTSRGSSSPLTLATTSALWSSRQGRDLVKFHTLERDDEAPQTFYAGVSRHREIDHDSNLYPTYRDEEARLRAKHEGGN